MITGKEFGVLLVLRQSPHFRAMSIERIREQGSIQGFHASAASLVRKGFAKRATKRPVSYEITPAGRDMVTAENLRRINKVIDSYNTKHAKPQAEKVDYTGVNATVSRNVTYQRKQEFIVAARAAGLRVELVSDDGVNVWSDPAARYPADTLWFNWETSRVTWGPVFEHTASLAMVTTQELVERVQATIGVQS
jgi:hypothetical protein